MNDDEDDGHFDPEKTAPRALRFLTGAAGDNGLHESTGATTGPPGEGDVARLESGLSGAGGLAGAEAAASGNREAEGIARTLVARAERTVKALSSGMPAHRLDGGDMLALEAVIHTRGRPALKVQGDDLEDLSRYPGAGIWKLIVDKHRAAILSAGKATAAVHVTDLLAGTMSWVQGSAWLIAPDLAITNRHVLFPPAGGTRLARRVPGTATARLRKDLDVVLDFAFHDAPPAVIRYGIDEILFVAAEADPVDAAILKVSPHHGTAPTLVVTTAPQEELERLYVIGHPGLMASVPARVRAVFGDPDEKKRISFGAVMEPASVAGGDILHDASTIGGYSGGCVMDFLSKAAAGLHYWGDTAAGNRAVSAGALRAHPDIGRFL